MGSDLPPEIEEIVARVTSGFRADLAAIVGEPEATKEN